MFQTNLVYSNDEQWRVYPNCKFHDPGAGVLVLGCGHISYIVKMHFSFKNLLLYSHAYIRQTKYKVNDVQERVYPNCTFHDPRGRDSDVRAWSYKSYSEYVLYSTLSIYSTLIEIVFRDYDAAFLYHRWFSFIPWWGCWYTNMSPSDKKSVLSLWYSGERQGQ